MPSLFAILRSCFPKKEAAAVWIRPLPRAPKDLNVLMKPRTVRGLTTPEAAEDNGTSLSISKT